MGIIMLIIYREVAEISARMLHAARAGDWDALVCAEGDCRERIEAMRRAAPETLSPAQVEEKRRILRQLLADDAEIRAHAQPWMARLIVGLESTGNRRRLDAS